MNEMDLYFVLIGLFLFLKKKGSTSVHWEVKKGGIKTGRGITDQGIDRNDSPYPSFSWGGVEEQFIFTNHPHELI